MLIRLCWRTSAYATSPTCKVALNESRAAESRATVEALPLTPMSPMTAATKPGVPAAAVLKRNGAEKLLAFGKIDTR